MVEQGIALVKAVRDRYNGAYRNPFNEIECGSNYARSMAAFALLPSFLGMAVDMGRGWLRFNPIVRGDFRCFFAVSSAWGEFECGGDTAAIRVLGGSLTLTELELPFLNATLSATLNSEGIAVVGDAGITCFAGGIVIASGSELKLMGLRLDTGKR